jgi:excinuclease ABC subunit A
MDTQVSIRIRGARTHNLKNVNLDLPRNRLIVVTGLSGSGKSSLAFDTLYAEGQRRYVESLSAYARQFLQLMEKPDVDLIEGLSPAISIEQKATSHNPRSTVGTVTEIHDYLRLLFARVGDPYCPDHPEQKLAAMTISQMVDATLALPEDTKLMIVAPVIVNRKGEHLELFIELRAKGSCACASTARSTRSTPCRGSRKTRSTRSRWSSTGSACARRETTACRVVRNGAAQRRRPRDRSRDG